jgi:4-hydroxybenzoate polyprenyltransferase
MSDGGGKVGFLVDLIKELRPKQWYKNSLLFVGIVFSQNIFHINMWLSVVLAFVIFCMLSGSVYIINDIVDVEKDRVHPKKRNRPIASGRINTTVAFSIALLLIFISTIASASLGVLFEIIVVLYIAQSLAYNYLFKDIFLVDVFVLSFGLVLRAIAGCTAIGVFVSPWLILCTFLMALFLSLAKRRHELILLNSDAASHRKNLKSYSVHMLDPVINMTTSAIIVSYSLYTFFSGRQFMMLTIPFVLYGLFKYTDNIHNKSMGGEPELMFKDPAMLLDITLWILTAFIVILGIPDAVLNFISTV